MIKLDLKEIEKKLDINIGLHRQLSSQFTWKEYMDISEDQRFMNTPVFSLPINNREGGKLLYIVQDEDSSPYKSAGCFGRFTYSTVSNHLRRPQKKVNVLFSLKMSRTLDDSRNNYCWFTEDQIAGWLDICKEETDIVFNYDIKSTKQEYTVTFDFKELDILSIKYVIFWTRYLYESPSSLYVLDALILKEKYFPEELVVNLLNLVALANSTNYYRMSSSQCIICCGKFLRKEQLVKEIKSLSHNTLSEIFSLNSRYYVYRSTSEYGSSVFDLISESGKVVCSIEPFITRSNLREVIIAPSIKRYYINPTKNWILQESRFERYLNAYNYLKSMEGKI